MDKCDAFDALYRDHQRAVALLKSAQEYGESVGADENMMLVIDTVLDVLDGNTEAWNILEKAVCERT